MEDLLTGKVRVNHLIKEVIERKTFKEINKSKNQ